LKREEYIDGTKGGPKKTESDGATGPKNPMSELKREKPEGKYGDVNSLRRKGGRFKNQNERKTKARSNSV